MINKWIKHPVILTGENVILKPLQKKHFDELYEAASDKSLWEFIPTDCSVKENFYESYTSALKQRKTGLHYPFVIIHKQSNKIIGSTRLFDLVPADKKLEIGWTWIQKAYWGTTINLECKLLLLTYCFETLNARRVQLKTKETNLRSRKAIQKLGAVFEGVLRKDRIQGDGTSRNTAYFSILDEEWPAAKNKIEKPIAAINKLNKKH